VPGAGLALGEHAARIVGDRHVEALVAERSLGPVGPDGDLPAERGAVDDGGQRNRFVAAKRVHDRPQQAAAADGLDQHVEDPATGEPHGEGLVVADAVGLQHRFTGREHGLRDLVDGALHAPAGDAADDLAVRADRHHGTRLAGRRPADADDRGDGVGRIAVVPRLELVEHLTHG